MADTANLYAPKAKKGARSERGKPYQRLLSWMSINHPGYWRLRMDILLLLYVIFGITALFSPLFFSFLAGADGRCTTDGSSYVDCVGGIGRYDYDRGVSISNYVWTEGFTRGDINLIFTTFILSSIAAALIWCYFVSRGARLTSVVKKLDSPRFLAVTLLLVPFVLAPMLAAYSAFLASHGGGLDTLWTGNTTVRTVSGESLKLQSPGYEHYDDVGPVLMFLLGLAIATTISVGLKIVMLEGLVGLVKSIVIAAILGTLTMVAFGFWIVIYDDFVFAGVMLAILLVYLSLFKRDLLMNRRHRFSQTIALSFALYWPGWVILLVAVFEADTTYIFDDLSGFDGSFLAIMIIYLVALLVEAMTFRDIARLKMLPKP
nr:hypothetical protein [Hyphomonas sp. Mor2]